MRHLIVFSVLGFVLHLSIFGSGCANSASQVGGVDSSMTFRNLVKSLPIMKGPMQWDVEGIFVTDHTILDDSLGFEKHECILGLLSDTSRFYEIMYVTTGDALYPAVRIFKKSGGKVADHIIAYTECAGADCSMKNCDSYVKIDLSGLSRGISYDEIVCDTLSVKSFLRHFEQVESISFDTLGNMVTKEVIE